MTLAPYYCPDHRYTAPAGSGFAFCPACEGGEDDVETSPAPVTPKPYWLPFAPTLRVRRLPHARDLPLPAYARPGDAGLDLRAAWPVIGAVHLAPGVTTHVPVGIAVEIPPGHEGQVRGRSGLLFRHGVSVPQTGTIDAGYRGEIVVALRNDAPEPFTIRRGDRIAQLVIAPVACVEVVEADALDDTPRGDGGFGSTGTK